MSTAVQPKVLSFAEAREAVEKFAATLEPTAPELMSLLDAVGLVLAEDLRADRDFPPFTRATRDGYALRAADVGNVPARLRCTGEIRAGSSIQETSIEIGPGQCVEIMTGAPVPAGADAVVMVENTGRSGDSVEIQRTVMYGENAVPTGSEAKRGDVMVVRGRRIDHTVVAVAAAIGRAEVAAFRRPRVAILATGDEVIDINLPPGPNEIRNSNSYSLAAQVQSAGGDPVILPVAADRAEDLDVLIRKGLEADMLLLSGGVSMGKYDLVEQVLEKLGAQFFFTGVAIQPGKPLVFGTAHSGHKRTPFFGLPGNPVSTMATFHLFARAVLDGLSGASPQPLLFSQAKVASEVRVKTGLTRFLPAKLGGTHESPTVELVKWQGSGDLMAVARSNCYIVVPPGRESFQPGEMISILPF